MGDREEEQGEAQLCNKENKAEVGNNEAQPRTIVRVDPVLPEKKFTFRKKQDSEEIKSREVSPIKPPPQRKGSFVMKRQFVKREEGEELKSSSKPSDEKIRAVMEIKAPKQKFVYKKKGDEEESPGGAGAGAPSPKRIPLMRKDTFDSATDLQKKSRPKFHKKNTPMNFEEYERSLETKPKQRAASFSMQHHPPPGFYSAPQHPPLLFAAKSNPPYPGHLYHVPMRPVVAPQMPLSPTAMSFNPTVPILKMNSREFKPQAGVKSGAIDLASLASEAAVFTPTQDPK